MMNIISNVSVRITFISLIFSFIFFGCSVNAFGKDNDIVIVLDPGHGGKESGAVNHNLGLIQKDINFKIAKAIEAELQKFSGIKVYLTHYGLPSNEALNLNQRADIAKNYNADMLVSLHINANGSRGAEIFISYKDKFYSECKRFGEIILNKLGGLGIVNIRGGVKIRKSEDNTRYPDGSLADYYGIIRNSYVNDIPCVLLEHCFIDSSDTRFIDSDDKLKAIGKADAEAIAEHFGLINSTFIDITNHWAQSVIEEWADKGYISGYKNRFHPNDSISRAEFVTILNNVLEFAEATGNPFVDVKETDWFKNAVLAAYNKKIIEGYNGMFRPNDMITREQACAILARLFEFEAIDKNALNKFSDEKNVSDWARDSLIALVEREFVVGINKNELGPKGNLKRAEAVVILDRIIFK